VKRSNRIRFTTNGLLDPRNIFTKLTRDIMAEGFACLQKDSGSGSNAEKIIGELQKKLVETCKDDRNDAIIIALCYLLDETLTMIYLAKGNPGKSELVN
jgi:hypothetical protein